MGFYLKNQNGKISNLKIGVLRGSNYEDWNVFLSKYALRQVRELASKDKNYNSQDIETIKELIANYDELNTDYSMIQNLGIVRFEEIFGVFDYSKKLPFILDVLSEAKIDASLYNNEMILVDMGYAERIENILNNIFSEEVAIEVDKVDVTPETRHDFSGYMTYVKSPNFKDSSDYNNVGMATMYYQIFKEIYEDNLNSFNLDKILAFENVHFAGVDCVLFLKDIMNIDIKHFDASSGEDRFEKYQLRYLLLGTNAEIYLGFRNDNFDEVYYFELK